MSGDLINNTHPHVTTINFAVNFKRQAIFSLPTKLYSFFVSLQKNCFFCHSNVPEKNIPLPQYFT